MPPFSPFFLLKSPFRPKVFGIPDRDPPRNFIGILIPNPDFFGPSGLKRDRDNPANPVPNPVPITLSNPNPDPNPVFSKTPVPNIWFKKFNPNCIEETAAFWHV